VLEAFALAQDFFFIASQNKKSIYRAWHSPIPCLLLVYLPQPRCMRACFGSYRIDMLYPLLGIAAVGLFVYLMMALLKPEMFP
jgi:K+-transporting ATPase KdpF subunit